MRTIVKYDCAGASCAATLDPAEGTTGLLIVSGGNEIRIGSHRGMAKLAGAISQMGFPVFRYDRRGVGDSEGSNNGFESSAPDIASALLAFRAQQPQLKRFVAYGNCDAATALWLHRPDGIDALVLGNPWVIEATTEEPAPAAARAYYKLRVRDPRAWLRLLAGRVNIVKAADSLSSAVGATPPSSLAARVVAAIRKAPLPTTVLLADHDGTAITFRDYFESPAFDDVRARIVLRTVASASHSFAAAGDHTYLRDIILSVLRANEI